MAHRNGVIVVLGQSLVHQVHGDGLAHLHLQLVTGDAIGDGHALLRVCAVKGKHGGQAEQEQAPGPVQDGTKRAG